MKRRGVDHQYWYNQAVVNCCHINGTLENDDDFETVQRVLPDVQLAEPRTILEIGCRLGLAQVVLRKSLQLDVRPLLFGIDIVPEFIDIARSRLKALGWSGITYDVADMHSLPIRDEAYEYVFSQGVLEHSYDPEVAMTEAFRVCRRRIYLEIDLDPEGTNRSHYTVLSKPEEWLEMCPDSFTVDHRVSKDTLILTGNRK